MSQSCLCQINTSILMLSLPRAGGGAGRAAGVPAEVAAPQPLSDGKSWDLFQLPARPVPSPGERAQPLYPGRHPSCDQLSRFLCAALTLGDWEQENLILKRIQGSDGESLAEAHVCIINATATPLLAAARLWVQMEAQPLGCRAVTSLRPAEHHDTCPQRPCSDRYQPGAGWQHNPSTPTLCGLTTNGEVQGDEKRVFPLGTAHSTMTSSPPLTDVGWIEKGDGEKEHKENSLM